MKKDFIRKKAYKKRSSRVRWPMVIMIGVIVLFGAGFWKDQHSAQPKLLPMLSAQMTRAKVWMTERKEYLHNDIEKVKRIAVNSEEAPPVQFEFYNALPNMQVAISAPSVETPKKKIIIHKPSENKKLAANSTIFDADRLQRAFDEEMKERE
jgi:hypothetical protein